MKRSTLFAALLSLVAHTTACGDGAPEGDDFREGLPNAEMVRLNVPGGTAKQGLRQDGLEGDVSGFYLLTRGATVVVNGGVGAVLALLDAITEHTPTTVNGDTAVWGPHTDALSPNTWKLTVKRVAERTYAYSLEGMAKDDGDDGYEVVLSGTHEVAADGQGNAQERFGKGEFLLDWDAAQRLPEHDDNVGQAAVTYSRLSAQAETKVDVTFTDIRDEDTGARADAEYRYTQTPGAGGEFQFSTVKDLAPGAALETLALRSRWQATGAGRTDLKGQGGDFTAGATASECWDASFHSRFLVASWEPAGGWGQASACVFADALYSDL